MKLETFFEKFDQFADAPDAVAKLRELILDLAIQGRLFATTDSNDWVGMRLGEIVAEGLSSVNPADTPSQLFELWSVPSYANGQPEILTGGEIGSTKRELPDRSILLGKINPHLNRVWKVARRTKHPLIASPEWITITPDKSWDADFLARLLTSPSFNRDLCSTAQGMGSLTRASTKKVAELEIRRPPLAEQKRIVAKVDELMALCDRLEAQQQERETRHAALARASLARFADAPTPANLPFLFHPSYAIPPADLRKTILTLAVQGKLVPQDPNDGETRMMSMEELVGRKNLKNGLSLPPVDGPSDFVCLPLSAMKGADIDCSFGKPIAITPERAEPYLIKHNDVFVIRGNGSKERVGIAGMARACPANVLFPDLFIRVPLPPDRIDGEYFLIAWNSPVTRDMLESLATTTAGIWKVNQGHISECEIPLPPLAEQRRIVAKVEQLMALVDALERQLAASRATAANLLSALVAELTTASAARPSANGAPYPSLGQRPRSKAENTMRAESPPHRHAAIIIESPTASHG